MAAFSLTQDMKSHSVFVALATNHSNLKIAGFFKVARSFVFMVKKNVLSMVKREREKHSIQSEIIMKGVCPGQSEQANN